MKANRSGTAVRFLLCALMVVGVGIIGYGYLMDREAKLSAPPAVNNNPLSSLNSLGHLLQALAPEPGGSGGAKQTPLRDWLARNEFDTAGRLPAAKAQKLLRQEIFFGNYDVVTWLLGHGAGVNHTDASGDAPLDRALSNRIAFGHDLTMIRILLARGADTAPLCLPDNLDRAVRNDDWELIRLMLACGADPNPAPGNIPLLTAAADTGNFTMVKFLVAHGAAVNPVLQWGSARTPLIAAARAGNLEIVKYLVERGAEINVTQEWSSVCSPIHAAAGSGNLDLVRYLVERGADLNCAARRGESPLTVAVRKNSLTLARFLIEKGANSDPALLAAVKSGNLAMIRFLVDHGAKVNAGATAAARNGNRELVTWFLAHGADRSALADTRAVCRAAEAGDLPMLKLLVSAGAPVNGLASGVTPLAAAAGSNRQATVDYLLAQGATDTDGAVRAAIVNGHEGLTRSLLGRGADATAGVHYYCTTLDGRTGPAAVSFLEYLFARGARADWSDPRDGVTPLMRAAAAGADRVAAVLLAHGAAVNAADHRGNTALMQAAREGRVGTVKLLLSRGADPRTRASDGVTALAASTWRCDLEVVKLLLDHGAEINDADDTGTTVLMRAAVGPPGFVSTEGVVELPPEPGDPPEMVRVTGSFSFRTVNWKHEPLTVIQYLVSRGADVTRRDRTGRNAADHARIRNQPAIAAYLDSIAGTDTRPLAPPRPAPGGMEAA